jgi:putative membrane protein
MEKIFFAIAGLIHLYIFVMESFLWGRPRINKAFGMSAEVMTKNRLFAFNQGFYNLFLALGAFAGIGLGMAGYASVGLTLEVYAGLSMVGASLVLLYSQPKLAVPAFIQGCPPLLGLIVLAIGP